MDRQKVIKGLQAHADGCGYKSHHCDEMECPYRYSDESCDVEEMCRDAIAMLKEQEAKQVIKQTYHIMMNRDYENPVEVTRYDWLCPTCKSLLCRDIDVIDDNYHFCKVCGQAVKWE